MTPPAPRPSTNPTPRPQRPPPPAPEGLSLCPQRPAPAAPRERPAVTTHNRGNHSVRSERHRYIRDADGAEELYDMLADPREWRNLAADPAAAGLAAELRKGLPRPDRPPAPGSADRILVYDPATDEARWEDRLTIRRDTPIP